MKTISKESFQKIEALIPGNYGNLHSRLRTILTEEEIETFAFPDFPSANMGQWNSMGNAELKTYQSANPTEKEEIAICLENMKLSILPKLSSMSFAPNLFRIPSEEQIFWYRGKDGLVRIVLAQWGFKLCNSPENVNVIDYIINLPRVLTQIDVTVHVVYSDDKPAANETFTRFMFNNEKEFTTDEDGVYCFGQMYPNQIFSVSDKYGTKCEFVVEKDKSDYYAQFDIHTSYQLQVINQNDEVIPAYNIRIDNVPYSTDNNGCVIINDVILTPTSKIIVSCDERSEEEFSLSRDAEQNHFVYKIKTEQHTSYTIKVINQDGESKPNYLLNVNGANCTTDETGLFRENDCLFEEGKKLHVVAENGSQFDYELSSDSAANDFVLEVKDDIYTSYSVKVTNQHGEVKNDFPVSIEGIQYKTDQNGVVVVNNVLWEEGKQIAVCADNGIKQEYILQRNSAVNNFVFMVEDKQVRIRVLDYDGTPLDNIMVYVDTKKGVTISGLSDANGYATFPANAFEHGKKAKIHFKVTKEYREKREQQKHAQGK